jgi:hypothetical protein
MVHEKLSLPSFSRPPASQTAHLALSQLPPRIFFLSDDRAISRLGLKQEEGYVWQGGQDQAYGKTARNPTADHPFDNRATTTRATRTLDRIGIWRHVQWRGRRRWKESFDALVAIECREPQAALRRAIEDVLSDALRGGSSGKFTAEQVTHVLAVACEPAEQSGRPIDAWTGRELADEMIRRGIVASISTSQVNRYLAEAALQPQRSKYWLNTTEKDPQLFEQQVQVVCQCYREAPELYFQHHTHTVSVDENGQATVNLGKPWFWWADNCDLRH